MYMTNQKLKMIDDLIQTIVNNSNIKTQLRCMQMDTCVYDNIYVYVLLAAKKMDQKILEQKKFCKLRILNCSYSQNICDVNHLTETLASLSG